MEDEEDPRRRRTGLWAGALLALAALVVAGLIVVPQLIAGGPPTQVRVPRVIGLSVNAAQQKLSAAGLQLGQQKSGYSTSVEAGHILRQLQKPNTFVDSGSAVDVVVSAGNDTATIPKGILNLSLREATRQLQRLHLNVVPRRDPSSSEPRNQVTATSPGPGVEVSVGSSVTVYYSTGYVTVPSVIGMRQASARAALISHDLVPIVSTVVSSAPAGLVTKQSLQAFTKQAPGTNVVISVSLGPSSPPTSPAPTTTAPTTTAPTTTAPTTTAPTTTAPTTTAPTTSKPTTAATSPTSSKTTTG
jgi:serine/threonine-protein kinase